MSEYSMKKVLIAGALWSLPLTFIALGLDGQPIIIFFCMLPLNLFGLTIMIYLIKLFGAEEGLNKITLIKRIIFIIISIILFNPLGAVLVIYTIKSCKNKKEIQK